jgi:hypothetical protein
MKKKIAIVLLCLACFWGKTFAQNPNFHIYLSLGQSNMEGNAKFEPQDTVGVNPRFKVLEAGLSKFE